MSKRTVFILLIIFSSLSGFAYSQEADLKKMVDSQGNVYAVDEENTMYTDGIPHPDRQPASVINLAYYFNQSLMLEVNGHLKEALEMYREILLLPEGEGSVANAKMGIRLRIGRLYDDNKFRGLVLDYFSVAKAADGKYEINPRAIK